MPEAHHPHPPQRDDLWTQMTSSSPWLQREGRGGEEEGGDEWITHPIFPPSLSTGWLRSHAEIVFSLTITSGKPTMDCTRSPHLQEQIELSVMPGAHHPHPPPRDDLWTQMTSSSPWLQREGRGGGDEWITHPIHPPSLSTGWLRSHAE
ncbi:hypothetical protein ACOMHN_009806 [Nucella lapillus]